MPACHSAVQPRRRGLPICCALCCALAGALGGTFVGPRAGLSSPRHLPAARRAEGGGGGISEEKVRQDLEMRVRQSMSQIADLKAQIEDQKALRQNSINARAQEVQDLKNEKIQLEEQVQAAEKRVADLEGILMSASKSFTGALMEAGVLEDPAVARDAALQSAAASDERAAESDREKEDAVAKLQQATATLEAADKQSKALQATEERAKKFKAALQQISKDVGSDGGIFSVFSTPSDDELIKDTLAAVKRYAKLR